MSVAFKINGQPKRIPSKWEELTLGQAIDLLQWSEDEIRKTDLVEMASILSGIEKSKLLDQKQETIESMITPMFMHMNEHVIKADAWKPPVQYVLDGSVYNREIKVGEKPYGCMDIFEKALSMECRFIEKIPLLIASMSYKGKFGGRDLEARKDIEDLANGAVMDMPLKEAHSLASFFLTKYNTLLRQQESKAMNTLKPKLGLASRISKYLASSVRFTRSQMEISQR
jgi:hypothetical protein